MTFDTFDFTQYVLPDEQKNLQRAYKLARSYAEKPDGWLLLMGNYGTGKTHLAAAIANLQRDRGAEVMFLTVPDLLDYLRMAYNPGVQVNFDQRFDAVKNVPLLVMDDMGVESASPWAKEKLFQLLDYRYVSRLPTVITTAKKLEELNERVATRLMDERRCFIYAITARSYAMRRKRT